MSNDISRLLEQPIKHYSGVRLQQGRILVDSDFNESAYLDQEDARHAWLDLVGPEGSPDQGFTIGVPLESPGAPEQTRLLHAGDELVPVAIELNGVSTPVRNVTVRAGIMFLGGLRFDLERPEQLAFQRDYLQLKPSDLPTATTGAAFNDFYYLHGWEQPVSAVEDQELVEPMLRGPDTSFRMRRMRRVEVLGNLSASVNTCNEALDVLLATRLGAERSSTTAPNPALRSVFDEQTFELKSKGRLRLAFKEGDAADTCGACNPEEQGYLGTANTTLRVLLTDSNHFVWGLDNAAPLFRVRITGLDATPITRVEVEMLTPPSGEAELPVPKRVVEILPFGALIEGGDLPSQSNNPHSRKVATEIGLFARVSADSKYDPNTRKFELEIGSAEDMARVEALRDELVHAWSPSHPDAASLNTSPTDTGRYFFMRLWHQADEADDIELIAPTDETGAALGDTGIVPVLEEPGRRGDYWVATLRLDTPRLVTPLDLLTEGGVPPHGPRHFYAPLALVDGGTDDVVIGNSDCRSRLRRINDRDCVTCTVGDGIHSSGEFRSIQAAIDSLPSSGGRIAIRPGVYREEIRIEGRRDVSLEGCGAATVIETPLRSPTGVLLGIHDAEGISVSGLTLHAVEQQAISARLVTELVLRDLNAIAGLFVDGEFQPGSDRSEAPLFEITQVGAGRVEGVLFDPARRPSLTLNSVELVTLSDLTLVGSPDVERAPSAPMINIVSSELVKLHDSTLRTFGQVGVSVRGAPTRDIEVRGLSIQASSHEASIEGEGPLVTETKCGIDVEDGDDIRILSCQVTLDGSNVSEHAGIVVRGRGVLVEKNTVEALFEAHQESPAPPPPASDITGLLTYEDVRAAFGGIHVRGGSSAVEIRRNRVLGGLGHGITLGSVVWHLASSPVQRARRIGGVGVGQIAPHNVNNELRGVSLGRNLGEGFEDQDGRDFLPVSEGPIRDLVVAENRIHNMLASGISVITVFGLLDHSGDFIDIEGGRIEGNVISKNLARPGLTVPDTGDVLPFAASLLGPRVISVLPFGGIVLGTAVDVDVRNNVIQDNVPLDVGGAGFVDAELLPINGIFILNGEGISVAGNRVVNNGRRAPLPEAPPPGASGPFTPLRPGVRAGIGIMLAGTGFGDDIGELDYMVSGRIGLSGDSSSLRVTNNTVVQPEGRALHVVATGPVSVDGNFFSSLGNHGAELPTDRYAFGDVVFIQNLGAPWEASDLEQHIGADEETGQPIVEGFTVARHALPYLRNTEPLSPRFFIGTGGSILFNNNQVVYDWSIVSTQPFGSSAPLSYFPTSILGLDHIGVNGNHFALRIEGGASSVQRPPIAGASRDALLAGLFAMGATVDVSRNRVAETVGRSTFSLLTVGEIMNITSLNQTTHDNFAMTTVLATGDTPNQQANVLRDSPNQILFKATEETTTLRSQARSFVRTVFQRLLRDPGR